MPVGFSLCIDRNGASELKWVFDNKAARELDSITLHNFQVHDSSEDQVSKCLFHAFEEFKVCKELKKALSAYERASAFATDGDMDLTRSYLYLDLEQWANAVESITSALQKGGLDDNKTGNAWLMLGMSQASLKNYAKARTAFNNAIKFEKSRNNAQQWLSHLTTLEQKAAAEQTAQTQP